MSSSPRLFALVLTFGGSSLAWASPSRPGSTVDRSPPQEAVVRPSAAGADAVGAREPGVRSPGRSAPQERWWESFGDPQLDALVGSAVAGNLDLEVAQARVEEARAVVLEQLAPLLPTASWDSSIQMAPLRSLGFQFGRNIDGAEQPALPDLYFVASSVFNLRAPIQLGGSTVLQHRAARKDTRAAKADLQAQKLELAGAVASAYFDAVAARAQLDVLRHQVEASEDLLELTQARFDVGQASGVEVLQQRQQLTAALARIPAAEAQFVAFQQQLAVLLGRAPTESFEVPAALPDLPVGPGSAEPAELLANRPDLRALQARREAATDRTKSARRAFAPTLALTAQAGLQAIHIGDWRSQGFWNLGALLSVPLSSGGARYGALKRAQAQTRIAAGQLRAASLLAQQEVQTALVRQDRLAEALALTREQAQLAAVALEEAQAGYAAGLSQYLTVLTALSAAQAAELQVVTAHRDLIAARIELYTALGDR